MTQNRQIVFGDQRSRLMRYSQHVPHVVSNLGDQKQHEVHWLLVAINNVLLTLVLVLEKTEKLV